MLWLRGSIAAVVVFALAAVYSTPAIGLESCTYLWNNYKIDRTLWPDDHGHSGGEVPDSPWEYVNSKWGKTAKNNHYFFEKGAYAQVAHSSDMCSPGGGGS
jgi:hypothetical protein